MPSNIAVDVIEIDKKIIFGNFNLFARVFEKRSCAPFGARLVIHSRVSQDDLCLIVNSTSEL